MAYYAHREISTLLPVPARLDYAALILFVGVGVNLHDKGFADHFAPYSASALASGVTPKRWPRLSALHD